MKIQYLHLHLLRCERWKDSNMLKRVVVACDKDVVFLCLTGSQCSCLSTGYTNIHRVL